MLVIESNFESFKQIIFKKLETYDDKFHNLEVNQIKCEKRLRKLKKGKGSSDEDEDDESELVKEFFEILKFFLISNVKNLFKVKINARRLLTDKDIEETLERIEKNERKLEGLRDRIGNLEVLGSKRSHTNREFDFEITEEPSKTRNSQEQKVNTFI